MRARYIIRHHPNLFTEILIEEEGKQPVQIETRLGWGVSREYCRQALEERGIKPTIERIDPHTEVFPWVEIHELPALNPSNR